MNEPITMDEIETAIFQMQKGKSPGLDGVPVEFYQENWSEIKNLYIWSSLMHYKVEHIH